MSRGGLWRTEWAVYRKELVDALRDRRTLLMVLLSSVAIGPLALVLISSLVASLEQRAEARDQLRQVHAQVAQKRLRPDALARKPAA